MVGVRCATAFLIALHVLQSVQPAGPAADRRGRAAALALVLLLGSTVFNFMAFRYLQLDEAMAILFSTPFLVAILAGPMLGEWVGWRRWTAILVGFAGVLVVVRPGMGGMQWAALLSFGSAICYAVLQHHHADAVAHRFQRDHAVLRQPVRLRGHGAGAALRLDHAAVLDRLWC